MQVCFGDREVTRPGEGMLDDGRLFPRTTRRDQNVWVGGPWRDGCNGWATWRREATTAEARGEHKDGDNLPGLHGADEGAMICKPEIFTPEPDQRPIRPCHDREWTAPGEAIRSGRKWRRRDS